MKSDIFVISKEAIDRIQRVVKEYNTQVKESEEQAKRHSRELARLNQKCASLAKSIDRLKKKKKQTDSDRQSIERMQQEHSELTKQAHVLATQSWKYDAWANAGTLEGVLPVWVPIGETKVLMNWKVIAPLNKLLREFHVEVVTDPNLLLLKVRYYTQRGRKYRGRYTLHTLTATRFALFGSSAPTCAIPEWIDTRIA